MARFADSYKKRQRGDVAPPRTKARITGSQEAVSAEGNCVDAFTLAQGRKGVAIVISNVRVPAEAPDAFHGAPIDGSNSPVVYMVPTRKCAELKQGDKDTAPRCIDEGFDGRLLSLDIMLSLNFFSSLYGSSQPNPKIPAATIQGQKVEVVGISCSHNNNGGLYVNASGGGYNHIGHPIKTADQGYEEAAAQIRGVRYQYASCLALAANAGGVFGTTLSERSAISNELKCALKNEANAVVRGLETLKTKHDGVMLGHAPNLLPLLSDGASEAMQTRIEELKAFVDADEGKAEADWGMGSLQDLTKIPGEEVSIAVHMYDDPLLFEVANAPKMLRDMMLSETLEEVQALPKMFVGASVSRPVEVNMDRYTALMYLTLTFATTKGYDPNNTESIDPFYVSTPRESALTHFKVSKLAHIFGVRNYQKLSMLVGELCRYGDRIFSLKALPFDPSDSDLALGDKSWSTTPMINVCETLDLCAFPVTKKFIVQHLLANKHGFTNREVEDPATCVPLADLLGPIPEIGDNIGSTYQAISATTWMLDSLPENVGFRVVFKGIVEAANAPDGKSYMEKCGAKVRDDEANGDKFFTDGGFGDLTAFLTGPNAVVFAVVEDDN